MEQETDRIRRLYDGLADRYDGIMELAEKLLLGNGRAWVCSRARGDVLEIAIGTGRNVPLYPHDVSLTGIDVSPGMLEVARARVVELGRAVDLRVGDAQALPFPDQTFDTVVCTLALCTIPDDRRAMSEAHRVLRPGGVLLLLEHVRSPVMWVQLGERLLDPLLVRWQGDHLLRDPADYLEGEGFAIEHLERSKLGIVERVAARKLDSAV